MRNSLCHNERRRTLGLIPRWASHVLLASLLSAGCEGRQEPPRAFPEDLGMTPGAPAPDSSPHATAETAAAATPPPAPGGAEPAAERPSLAAERQWTVGSVQARTSALMATQRAVRVARQDGYDRIVLDFGGDAVPGYAIEYVDTPVRQCGSGDELRLAGDAWLRVRLEPAQAHDEEGRATIADRALRPELPNVVELRLICDFEGQVEWVAGVRSPEQYRVMRLSAPSRLVIDIRHPAR